MFRPLNLLIIFFGCFVGSMLVHGASISAGDLPYLTSLAALSTVFTAAFGNITNDIADRKIDSVNRADRPIPSGQISVPVAVVIALSCLCCALIIAWSLSVYHVEVVAVAGLILLAYNWVFKKAGIIGTIVVSGLVAMTIGFGAMTGASSSGRAAPLDVIVQGNVLVTMSFAFVLMLARELIKDVQDVEGDLKGDVRSVPITIGTKKTLRITRGIVAVTIIAAPMPYLHLEFSGLYLLLMIPVLALLVRVMAMLGDPEPDLFLVSRHLKLSMCLGMLALACAAIWPV